MTFQLTDIPRLLPELMLLVVALLVLGSDLFERWSGGAEEAERRGRAAGELAASMLGLVFIVALVQSRYLFTIGDPLPTGGLNGCAEHLHQPGPQLAGRRPRRHRRSWARSAPTT